MVSQLEPAAAEVIYPDRDGNPMSDNTEQFRWIVTIEQNLEWLFADRADVFVAGDLLWYPIEGNNKLRTAPDILVAFGRPKGRRGSYQQWKEANIPPQVVFEILSPGNTRAEMYRKLLFYDRHGVEEYYLYDPDTNELNGWQRVEGFLDLIEPLVQPSTGIAWVSPRLGIQFQPSENELQIFRPDGQRFFSYTEIARQAEQESQRAEQESQRAEQERQRAEQERQRAEQAEARADQEQQRADRLAEQLRAMGIDPDN